MLRPKNNSGLPEVRDEDGNEIGSDTVLIYLIPI